MEARAAAAPDCHWDPREPKRSRIRSLLHMEDDSEYLCTPRRFSNPEVALTKYALPKKLDCSAFEVQESGSTATPGGRSARSSQLGADDAPTPRGGDRDLYDPVPEAEEENHDGTDPSADAALAARPASEAERRSALSELRGWLLAWDVGVRTITAEQLRALYDSAKTRGGHADDSREMVEAQEKMRAIEAQIRGKAAVPTAPSRPLMTEHLQDVDWQAVVSHRSKFSELQGWLAAREVGVRTITAEQLWCRYNAIACHEGRGSGGARGEVERARERICAIESADRADEARRRDSLSQLFGCLAAWDVGVRNVTAEQLESLHDAAVARGGHSAACAELVGARARIQKVAAAARLGEARDQYTISTLRGWLAAREVGVRTVTLPQLRDLCGAAEGVRGSALSDAAVEDARQRLSKLEPGHPPRHGTQAHHEE